MRVLVVGTGSIGTRHIRNIIELKHDVYAFDIKSEHLDKVAPMVKETFFSLDEALKVSPEVVFICTYNDSHIPLALACAEAGCHLFIEKPLSLNLDKVDELIDVVNRKRLISMVGCNMRFHPAVAYLHDMLEDNPLFSKPLWANLEFGYYLPLAKKNYETSYMANRSMGGDIILDVIHELDYAMWFFGEPMEVFCVKGILSHLEIDTENIADMIIKFKSGVRCVIHMDYLQHGYSRRCKITSEHATIFWDFALGKIGMITEDGKGWVWKDFPLEIYYNQMYIDEVCYFFDCLMSGKQTFNSISQSLDVLRLALSANSSCQTNRWECIKR